MKQSDYLTIEETARKLGRPTVWVKEQICQGKLDANLSGRQWLIPSYEVDRLTPDNLPPHQSGDMVHNFLPARPPGKANDSGGDKKRSGRVARHEAPERSRKSSSSSRKNQPNQPGSRKPTLTQRITVLDREFDRLSHKLKTAVLEYRAAVRSGRKVHPPNGLLQEWKTIKAELKSLVAKASYKGLVLPPNLTIYEVLAQESGLIEKSRGGDDLTTAKPPTRIGGIDGYYGGPGRTDSRKVRKLPASVEAQLTILRSRERIAAHTMRDRSKSRAERDAAELDWARARLEAEKLERYTG